MLEASLYVFRSENCRFLLHFYTSYYFSTNAIRVGVKLNVHDSPTDVYSARLEYFIGLCATFAAATTFHKGIIVICFYVVRGKLSAADKKISVSCLSKLKFWLNGTIFASLTAAHELSPIIALNKFGIDSWVRERDLIFVEGHVATYLLEHMAFAMK